MTEEGFPGGHNSIRTPAGDIILPGLQLILDRMPVGCVINGPDFCVVYWNGAAERIFGFTKDEVIGRNPFGTYIPESARKYVEKLIARVREGDMQAHGLNENVTKDGRTIFCEWHNTPLVDRQGGFLGFMSMVQDVTERIKSEKILRDSEAEMRALFAAMTDLVLVVDSQGRHCKIGQTQALPLGLPYEELLGKTLHEVLPPELADFFMANTQKVLATQQRSQIDYSMEIAGRETWYSAIVNPMSEDKVLVVARDVTDRRHAEQRIVRLNRLYQVLSSIGQVIVRVKNRDELFVEACRIAVEQGEFLMSWIGLIDQATYEIKPLAQWGDNTGYLKDICISVQPIPEGLGPTGIAAREGRFSLCNDYKNDPRLAPWRDRVAQAGFRSSAAFPIRLRERSIGAMSFYSGQVDAFDDDNIELLNELTSNISFALELLEQEEERRRAEAELERHMRVLDGILATSPDHFFLMDNEGRYLYASPGAPEIVGLRQQDIVGRNSTETQVPASMRDLFEAQRETVFVTGAPVTGETNLLTPRGMREFEYTINPIEDGHGTVMNVVVTVHDITDHKAIERQILYDALHDKLTGLPNRTLFMDRLDQAIAHTRRRQDSVFAVLILDLDRFKNVNDSLGHMAGDQMLIQVSHRLQECLRPGDTVARLGGDEFAILFGDIEDVEGPSALAHLIQDQLASPLAIMGHEVFTTASIGIALGTRDYAHASEIMRDTDIAMNRAKIKGKACHEVFDDTMLQRAKAVLRLETDLRHAIDRNEFRLHYQPIVLLQSNRIIGFEALVRWYHSQRGVILPGEFIPMAEETGLILPIGKWVAQEACRQMQNWHQTLPCAGDLSISINISSRQFAQEDFLEEICAVETTTGLPLRYLHLELTESLIMEQAESVTALLLKLRALDVQVQIDDFGTGYSSLSYLHRFPATTLKIDRSFVNKIEEGEENLEIIRTIIALGQSLNIDIIAEGIETEKQLRSLQQIGCRHGQGYYFARPADAGEAEKLIRQQAQQGSAFSGDGGTR